MKNLAQIEQTNTYMGAQAPPGSDKKDDTNSVHPQSHM